MDIIINRPGRPVISRHNKLIKQLRMRGWGSVRICNELQNRGITLSRQTVANRLHQIDDELRAEGHTVIIR